MLGERMGKLFEKSFPTFSLRLGHVRGLTAHWAVIQYPHAASLPFKNF